MSFLSQADVDRRKRGALEAFGPMMIGDTLGNLGFPFQPFGRLGMAVGPTGGIGTDFYGAGVVDWRNDPRWQQLPDNDRVFLNPNIDDTIWRPRADVFDESRHLLRVEFELPGVPADDIDLTVVNNVITVAALKPQTRKEEIGVYFQRERHFGRFFRSLPLPFTVDSKSVRANLENGVLKVVLTKTGGPTGSVPITVSSGGQTIRPFPASIGTGPATPPPVAQEASETGSAGSQGSSA